MTAPQQADKIKWLNSDRCIHFDVCYTRLRDNTVCYNEQNLPCCNYSCPLSSAIQQELEKVRPVVWQFALLMEKKLRENDHKGHWSKCNQEYLLTRLDEEVQELHKCFFFYSPGDMNFFMDGQHEDKIPGEAADVANFAMMLWDNFGEKESLRREP